MASTTILSDNGVSSGSAGIKTTGGNDGVLALQTTTAGGAATTAVTIDTSQNVGVGVTPSAWSGGYKSLDITSGASFFGYPTSYAGVATNAVNNGGWKYRNTAAAVLYQQEVNSHVWYTAASGTAGNAISFTQAMTLDSSGNLLVGAGTAATRISAGSGQFSTSSGMYIFSGSVSDNSFLSRSSSGSGTTTWYIGNQAITTSSDIRLKENVKPTERNAIELLNQWEIIDHTWNDPSDQCENNRNSRGVWTGISAQQVQQVTPWLVNKPVEDTNEDGSINPWTMDFGYAVPLLVKAIQEQQALITTLTERITALEAK